MSSHDSSSSDLAIVAIGRNEGERLVACLKSARGHRVVYVDSGSSDGSVDAAKALGAEIVLLDTTRPFTAARARNAGLAKLKDRNAPAFVQFVDGDCEFAEGWLEEAARFLKDNPKAAFVCGRVREKYPERSIYNALVDREWEGEPGETEMCGGNAMARLAAIEDAGEYREDLIAGEEPELCVRLRTLGWRIYRLDAEMVRHDIAMTSLGQWLKRARRAGHAFAQVSDIHRRKPERIWRREARRALFWTCILGVALLGGLFAHQAFFLLALLYPAQMIRIALRDRPVTSKSFAYGALTTLQKPWEAAGVVQYWYGKIFNRPLTLIEYKSAHHAD